MHDNSKAVGIVAEIRHFPVKSMAGETVDQVHIGWHGLAGDRRFAFMKTNCDSGLPWLSGRELTTLLTYSAKLEDARDENSAIHVSIPGGTVVSLRDEELRKNLENLSGSPLQLVRLWRGTFDSMPISLITTSSIEAIAKTIAIRPDILRYRPNIVIKALDSRSYPEDRWIGELLVFGETADSARIRIARKDVRCSIVNFDPCTGETNPEILREIAMNRKNMLGVYGITERPGRVRVGDLIRIER
ncbi:MAG TPA: MOSC domain-containing protein [Candidatus Angelobacter sp.]|nr:MOSC domain-containing protein [Candidatus Angelobacter sp.]